MSALGSSNTPPHLHRWQSSGTTLHAVQCFDSSVGKSLQATIRIEFNLNDANIPPAR
jgi:hypothetical protein